MNRCPRCNSLGYQELSDKKYKCNKCNYIWTIPLFEITPKEDKEYIPKNTNQMNKLLNSNIIYLNSNNSKNENNNLTNMNEINNCLNDNKSNNTSFNNNLNCNSNNFSIKINKANNTMMKNSSLQNSFKKINENNYENSLISNNFNIMNQTNPINSVMNSNLFNTKMINCMNSNLISDNMNNSKINNCQNSNFIKNNMINPLSYSMNINNSTIYNNHNSNLINNYDNKNSYLNNNDFLINIKFFNLENQIRYPIKDLSGLINLCLMKYLSEYFDNDKILEKLSPEIKTIIIKLRKNINFNEDNRKNIYNLLNEKKGNNILIYSQYLDMVLNSQKIKDLINLLTEEQKKKSYIYWGCLSNYKEYSSFFEQELIKDLKKTRFDYSLISLGILEQKDELYKKKKNTCPNMLKRILYHGSQIDPISKILTSEFKYAKKPFYGMGIYFTDIIDYIAFYCGGTNLDNRRDNFGKIIPIESTFSFIGSEVFYDKTKFKQIKDRSLFVSELDHFPSYEELQEKYSDKMVKPNGIHFIRVDNAGNSLTETCFFNEKRKGVFLGNEYCITEKYQILPIYSLTVKRNEFFILWRDPNFKGKNQYTDFLLNKKIFCMEKAKMN